MMKMDYEKIKDAAKGYRKGRHTAFLRAIIMESGESWWMRRSISKTIATENEKVGLTK